MQQQPGREQVSPMVTQLALGPGAGQGTAEDQLRALLAEIGRDIPSHYTYRAYEALALRTIEDAVLPIGLALYVGMGLYDRVIGRGQPAGPWHPPHYQLYSERYHAPGYRTADDED
jgi:hypothetical protein